MVRDSWRTDFHSKQVKAQIDHTWLKALHMKSNCAIYVRKRLHKLIPLHMATLWEPGVLLQSHPIWFCLLPNLSKTVSGLPHFRHIFLRIRLSISSRISRCVFPAANLTASSASIWRFASTKTAVLRLSSSAVSLSCSTSHLRILSSFVRARSSNACRLRFLDPSHDKHFSVL